MLSPDPGERRQPPPVQDPAPARPRTLSYSARAWEGRGLGHSRAPPPRPRHAGRDASPRGSLPRLYLLFHVPQQFLFDCVLRAAHGAAGGGEVMPSCPPSPPRALAASAPLSSAPHAQGGARARRAPCPPPPQQLPGAGLRSHLPSPAQTSGGWPGPFPQPGAGGALCHREEGGSGRGGGRGEAARSPGGGGPPGARLACRCHGNAQAPAPRVRTRIVSACSQFRTALRRVVGTPRNPQLMESCSRRSWPRPS